MLTAISRRHVLTSAVLLAGLLAVSACGFNERRPLTGTNREPGGPIARESNRPAGVRADLTREQQGSVGVNVNRFAWQAALDTLSFMPIRASDPFGGLVATDWYTPRETPDERLRVNVRIRGRELRSDTVRVTVFREVRAEASGAWQTAPVAATTGRELENVILTRARALRVEAQTR